MRTIHLETTLPTSADRVWRAMQSPVTFLYVCKGLFAVPALSGRAEPLRPGERGTGWLFAFHVLPAYRHTIEVIDVDEPTQTIRTHEHGGVLRAWNHTLTVERIDDHAVRVSGDLTLLGVTKPLAVDVAVRRETEGGRSRLAFSARTHIDRLEFGMNSGFPLVSRDIELVISSEAAAL